MSDKATATITTDYEDSADEDVLLEAAVEDAEEVPESLRRWCPTEYVVAILGHRGSGKSTLLARLLLTGLVRGYPVFTNLQLYPEKLGIDKVQHPLELDNLLSFDPDLSEAIIGIEELGTWIERMRAISTTNIIVNKFFQLFIRKKGLRIIFTNQSPYLPGGIWEQVDLIIYAHDLFYSEYGRESNLAKGTSFYYVVYDKSGIFTGRQGTVWTFGLRKANRLWDKFNSYQMFDPLQWARKTRITGGETILDLDEGEMYSASEEGLRTWQKDVGAYSVILTKILGSYQSNGFLELTQKYNALQDLPDRYVFSVDGLRKAITHLKGKKREDAEKTYQELRVLAGGGQIARFGPRHEIIELAKPVTEAIEVENLGSLSKKEWLNTAPIDDVVRDLYATGYKRNQIARKLKISEQTVNTALQEDPDE